MHGKKQSKGGFNNSPTRIFFEIGGVFAAIFSDFYRYKLCFMAFRSTCVKCTCHMGKAPGEVSWDYLAPAVQRCASSELETYLKTITAPLIVALDSSYDFKFVVVDDPAVSAFALPGGFMTINRGLFECV